MQVEHRKNRTAIRVSGADATKLLNDVLTGTFVESGGTATWWALLSPQGKVQVEGLAGWFDGAFWLDMHESIADYFMKRMRLYKLRADVTFENLKETHAVGWSEVEGSTNSIQHADERASGLGFRHITPSAEITEWLAEDTYLSKRIAAGITELGADYETDTLFPHDIAMDLLGGIDFEKGCYIGQEVVSRMKHRGTARRRPVIVSGGNLTAGSAITASGRDAGTLGQVHNGKAVSVVRLDRFKNLDEVFVDEARVTLALPTWASYVLADSTPE